MALPARVLVARGVGDKVRAYRKSLDWSQERLARECKPPLTRQTIYTVEAGTNVPEWDTLERIAEALGVPFWELMPERPFFEASQEGVVLNGKWVARESNPEPTDRWSVAPEIGPERGVRFPLSGEAQAA
jgi:transcriptional regulator with XRE-family HTH domain